VENPDQREPLGAGPGTAATDRNAGGVYLFQIIISGALAASTKKKRISRGTHDSLIRFLWYI